VRLFSVAEFVLWLNPFLVTIVYWTLLLDSEALKLSHRHRIGRLFWPILGLSTIGFLHYRPNPNHNACCTAQRGGQTVHCRPVRLQEQAAMAEDALHSNLHVSLRTCLVTDGSRPRSQLQICLSTSGISQHSSYGYDVANELKLGSEPTTMY